MSRNEPFESVPMANDHPDQAISLAQALLAPRIVIEDTQPVLDAGSFAAKAVSGQSVAVSTKAYSDGHDRLAVMLNWRQAHSRRWHCVPMQAAGNCRIFPGVPVEQIQEELEAVVADPEVKVTVRDEPNASPVSEMRPDVMKAITRAVRTQYPGVPVVPYLESGGTDGKWYRIAGIPTFASSGLFTKESEMFAHGLNERLPVKAFYEGLEHIYQLAVELGGAPAL